MESISIENRTEIKIQGATRMATSTETEAVVEVGDCNVVIGGQNLEITKLDLDNQEVCLKGKINSIKYTQKSEKTSIFKRIFK